MLSKQFNGLIRNRVEGFLVFEKVKDAFNSLSIQYHSSDFTCVALRIVFDNIFNWFLTELHDELIQIVTKELLLFWLRRTVLVLVHWQLIECLWYFFDWDRWSWWGLRCWVVNSLLILISLDILTGLLSILTTLLLVLVWSIVWLRLLTLWKSCCTIALRLFVLWRLCLWSILYFVSSGGIGLVCLSWSWPGGNSGFRLLVVSLRLRFILVSWFRSSV